MSILVVKLKAEILQEWETQSRRKVEAAKTQSRLALRDSLPEFLDQLAITLESDNPKEEAVANAEVAREHGEDRAQQPEYNLEEVIFEYHILREVIIQKIAGKGEADPDSLRLIHKFIDFGIGKAAATFAKIESDRQLFLTHQFEEAKIGAERSNQAKSAFLANMSHEIRTPLSAIVGFVELLKEKNLAQEEVLKYHTVIDQNSKHLLQIIDDILDLSKVEAGKMLVENVEFSFVDFLADFSSYASIKAKEKGIVFKFKSNTKVPESIISDPTRLRQILTNVVGNAIKFTDQGFVELTVDFKEDKLHFTVKDSGLGISEDQRNHLFQVFSQADSSTTRKFGGTGLGLVLTKKISQAFGGDFELIESKIGNGSTFEAKVPIALPKDKTTLVADVNKSSLDLSEEIDLHDFEILLVEDSLDNQYLIQKMLSKTMVKFMTAVNGAEGVRLALAHKFDLVLMDIQMPVMDGHEAARTLRNHNYTGPIVALTAHAMKEEQQKAQSSGFSGYLSKPIDRMQLIELVKRESQLKLLNFDLKSNS